MYTDRRFLLYINYLFIYFLFFLRIARNSIELLRPVFLFILCNPSSMLSESCQQQTWHLLIKTSHAFPLQIEALLWFQTCNINSCINTNYRILELTELAILNKDRKLYIALVPLIASLALELVKNGCDPRANFEILSEIFKDGDNEAASVTVALLAELILICPAVYLNDVIRLCEYILKCLSFSTSHIFISA